MVFLLHVCQPALTVTPISPHRVLRSVKSSWPFAMPSLLVSPARATSSAMSEARGCQTESDDAAPAADCAAWACVAGKVAASWDRLDCQDVHASTTMASGVDVGGAGSGVDGAGTEGAVVAGAGAVAEGVDVGVDEGVAGLDDAVAEGDAVLPADTLSPAQPESNSTPTSATGTIHRINLPVP